MADLKETTLLIGLLIGLVESIKWLAKAVLAQTRVRSEKASDKAGDKSAEEWKGCMRELHREANEELMADIRNLFESRNLVLLEKVTNPIVAAINGLRTDMQQEQLQRARERSQERR